MKLVIRQAHMKIQPQRAGDTRSNGFPRASTIGAAQHLAHQPAIGDRRITMPLTRCPPRFFGCQGGGHGVPLVKRFGRQRLTHRRQAGLMAEQLAQSDGSLARRGEFRPEPGHGFVQLQLALFDQLQNGHAGKSLGAGEQVENGVGVPRLGTVLVGSARPQIDDGLATNLNAQGSAALLRVVKERRKGFTYCFELKFVMTLDLQRLTPDWQHEPDDRLNGAYCFSDRALWEQM